MGNIYNAWWMGKGVERCIVAQLERTSPNLSKKSLSCCEPQDSGTRDTITCGGWKVERERHKNGIGRMWHGACACKGWRRRI